MGPLDPAAAREALVNPAASLGVTFEEEAVAEILEITECYPYFLQECGAKGTERPHSPYRCSTGS